MRHFLLGVALATAMPAAAESLPDSVGRQELLNICGSCHSAEVVLDVRKSREDWQQVIDTMRGFGAKGRKEDFDAIIDYLTNNLGPVSTINVAGPAKSAAVIEPAAAPTPSEAERK